MLVTRVVSIKNSKRALVGMGLYQLLEVTAELRDRGVVVADHLQAPRKFSQNQRAHPFANFVDIDVPHHVRPAVRRKQAVHQGLQTVGFMDDDLGVLRQVA